MLAKKKCVCVCVCVCVCSCARSHFGSRYRHRFSFVGTFVFLPRSYSAVLILFFTAESLDPLVHQLHQAQSYTCQHRRNSFLWCVANQAPACSPTSCVHMSRHGQSATQGNPQKHGAW